MRYNEWTGTWDEWNSLPGYKQSKYRPPKATPKTKPLDPNKPAKEQKERKKPPGMRPLKPSGMTAQRKRLKAKE